MVKSKNAGANQRRKEEKVKRRKKRLAIRNLSNLPEWAPLRKHEVLSIVPVCQASWDNGVRSGRYPPAVYLSPHTPTWTLGVIKQVACGEYQGEAA